MSTEEKIKALSEPASARIVRHLIRANIQACESPIEELLMWAFLSLGHHIATETTGARWAREIGGTTTPLCVITGNLFDPVFAATVHQQAQIGKYRADFALLVSRFAVRNDELVDRGTPALRVVVEVDGHDFHERTKEQAARDKSRDRKMLAAGWQTIRFSGSEVYADAHRCVQDIIDAIETLGTERHP